MKSIFKYIYYVFSLILYPIVNYILVFVLPFIKKRRDFELKNGKELGSKSFHLENLKASVTFEVSSEGELEQVKPLIDKFLSMGKRIELIFCSPSVEKTCLSIYKKYSSQIRYLRLPLVTYNPLIKFLNVSTWMTSSKLILCRYDFFPELFFIGMQRDISFILVSGTLKGKEHLFSKKIKKNIFKKIYAQFDLITVGTQKDFKNFSKLLNKENHIKEIDFRILQITKRNEKYLEKLSTLNFYQYYHKYINSFPIEDRIVLGSYWDYESHLFSNNDFRNDILNKKVSVTVIPHNLSENSITSIIEKFQQVTLGQIPCYIVDPSIDEQRLKSIFHEISLKPGLLILAFRGILCEIYNFYQNAYVGGGFGRSIHSVLEPYLGNTQVYVGPIVHRSTEYDMIKEYSPHLVHRLEQMQDFYLFYKKNKMNSIDKEIRIDLQKKTGPIYQDFISKF